MTLFVNLVNLVNLLKIFNLFILSLLSLLFFYASPILGPAFGVEIGVGISILPIVVS